MYYQVSIEIFIFVKYPLVYIAHPQLMVKYKLWMVHANNVKIGKSNTTKKHHQYWFNYYAYYSHLIMYNIGLIIIACFFLVIVMFMRLCTRLTCNEKKRKSLRIPIQYLFNLYSILISDKYIANEVIGCFGMVCTTCTFNTPKIQSNNSVYSEHHFWCKISLYDKITSQMSSTSIYIRNTTRKWTIRRNCIIFHQLESSTLSFSENQLNYFLLKFQLFSIYSNFAQTTRFLNRKSNCIFMCICIPFLQSFFHFPWPWLSSAHAAMQWKQYDCPCPSLSFTPSVIFRSQKAGKKEYPNNVFQLVD